MNILLTATIDWSVSTVQLKFSYNKSLIDWLKVLPGPKWDAKNKTWTCSYDCYEGIIKKNKNLKIHEIIQNKLNWDNDKLILGAPNNKSLRDYQIEGVKFLVSRATALLSFDMRMGKTPTSLIAAKNIFKQGLADLMIVIYPASVQGEWVRQSKEWIPTIPFISLEGLQTKQNICRPVGPYILGIHYEILSDWVGNLKEPTYNGKNGPNSINLESLIGERGLIFDLLQDKQSKDLRRFGVIYDEVQWVKNRKGGRFLAARMLSRLAKIRWGLSGTPMRNRNRDLYGVLEVLHPGSMGYGYTKYANRYCGYHENDYGYYVDDQSTNTEELKGRLNSISLRKTRHDVIADLPKSERNIIYCDMNKEDIKNYKQVERSYSKEIKSALENPDKSSTINQAIIEKLVSITTKGKISTLIDRIINYIEAGHKIVVFSHFHETTDLIIKAINEHNKDSKDNIISYAQIDGRVDKNKRRELIDEWKSASSGYVLVAGTLAAGIGIDLSQAEAALFIELEWVPADFRQAEDRIQDIHKGTRKTAPIYEYLIAKNTIDVDMIKALISKMQDIEAVVGKDRESSELKDKLHEVDPSIALKLDTNDNIVIQNALLAARDRILNKKESDYENVDLVSSILNEVWDEENDIDNDEN